MSRINRDGLGSPHYHVASLVNLALTAAIKQLNQQPKGEVLVLPPHYVEFTTTITIDPEDKAEVVTIKETAYWFPGHDETAVTRPEQLCAPPAPSTPSTKNQIPTNSKRETFERPTTLYLRHLDSPTNQYHYQHNAWPIQLFDLPEMERWLTEQLTAQLITIGKTIDPKATPWLIKIYVDAIKALNPQCDHTNSYKPELIELADGVAISFIFFSPNNG